MKTKKAAGEAAQSKKNTKITAAEHETIVCISTAERIRHIADLYSHPPALVAGAFAGIGLDLLHFDKNAEFVGTSFSGLIMQVIKRDFPKRRCIIPILTSDYVGECSRAWAKDLDRPLGEFLGYVVELGIRYYQEPGFLKYIISDVERVFFLASTTEIREEADEGDSKVEALLKPAPKGPPAFIAFEKLLVAQGGTEA